MAEQNNKVDSLINGRMCAISTSLSQNLKELKEVMTIPVERLQMALDEQGFLAYCQIRSTLIDVFSLIEVLVDSASGEIKCIGCGKTAQVQTVNGVPVLKGEITHWIENGRIVHDYTCDECIRKQN